MNKNICKTEITCAQRLGLYFEENVFFPSSHGTVAVSGGMGMMCGWQHDVMVAVRLLLQLSTLPYICPGS